MNNKDFKSFKSFIKSHRLHFVMMMIFCLFVFGYADSFNPRLQYYRSQLDDNTLTQSLRIEYFDSLLAFNPADRARIIFRKAVYLRNMGKRIEALNAFKESYAEGNMLPEKDRLESLYAIGTLYYDLGNPVKALGEMANLMALPKPDSLKYYNVKGLVTIYNVYITIRNIKGALNA